MKQQELGSYTKTQILLIQHDKVNRQEIVNVCSFTPHSSSFLFFFEQTLFLFYIILGKALISLLARTNFYNNATRYSQTSHGEYNNWLTLHITVHGSFDMVGCCTYQTVNNKLNFKYLSTNQSALTHKDTRVKISSTFILQF